jgi:cellulose synthase/poly-beta-1,6-N-acetylglucosamine synthase-like glycosyltransferase
VITSAILVSISALYFGTAAYLSGGIHNRDKRRTDLPKVSVVIPARDEESNICTLLDSLLNADYPPELLQIIIVNDRSEDQTRQLALGYQSRFKCDFRVVDVPADADIHLLGKIRPLSYGIDHATGEIILMTDADCFVPPQWVRGMVSFYSDGIGMVCGTTLPNPHEKPNPMLNRFETLDWAFLLGACVSLSGRGNSQALVGNNFSIRKTTYDEIGTFRALKDTFIDDLTLMLEVKNTGKWNVIFPGDSNLVLYTKPLTKFREVVTQRFRWTKGAKTIEYKGAATLGFGALVHLSWPLWFWVIGLYALIPYMLIVA